MWLYNPSHRSIICCEHFPSHPNTITWFKGHRVTFGEKFTTYGCWWLIGTHRKTTLPSYYQSPLNIATLRAWLFAEMSHHQLSPQDGTHTACLWVLITQPTPPSHLRLDLPGKRNICWIVHDLWPVAGHDWPPGPESKTPAAPLLRPHLILFSSLFILVGQVPAHPLSEPVSMMRRVRRAC